MTSAPIPIGQATLGNPAASIGYVGYALFENVFGSNVMVRATSCDIKLTQAITKPNVVDSRFDRTVYQLGPKIIEGSIAFPAIFDQAGNLGTADVAKLLYVLATQRDYNGHLTPTNIDVKYTNINASFQYSNSIIDTYSWKVAQSDVVSVSCGVKGTNRVPYPTLLQYPNSPPLSVPNTRIATWNDAVISLNIAPDTANNIPGSVLGGEYVRSFDLNINNNSQFIYTLNQQLAPQDIIPTKRDVTGTMVIMGRQPVLGDYAFDNQTRCTEVSTINWGYTISDNGLPISGCSGGMNGILVNVVFEIETIALTNDLLETTINYHVLPGGYLPGNNTTSNSNTDPMLVGFVDGSGNIIVT